VRCFQPPRIFRSRRTARAPAPRSARSAEQVGCSHSASGGHGSGLSTRKPGRHYLPGCFPLGRAALVKTGAGDRSAANPPRPAAVTPTVGARSQGQLGFLPSGRTECQQSLAHDPKGGQSCSTGPRAWPERKEQRQEQRPEQRLRTTCEVGHSRKNDDLGKQQKL
jgi:hypothetical protein